MSGTTDRAGLLKSIEFGPSVVGMWSVQFLVGGAQFDFGFQQWHSDGTEILNSGSRAPSTENFCLGVWSQVAPFHYRLNHIALSYDTAGNMNARVNIKEDVTLDPRGNEFSGPFTLDVYGPNGGGSILQHVAGRVVGKRVTITTTP